MAAFKSLDEVSVQDIYDLGLLRSDAELIHEKLRRILLETKNNPVDSWQRISKRILRPELPFSLHQMMFYGCYKGYVSDTPPAWIPDR